MEPSNSKTLKQGQETTHESIGDNYEDDFVREYEIFGLDKYEATTSRGNNDANSVKIENQWLKAQETMKSSVSDQYYNLWNDPSFFEKGESSDSNVHNNEPKNFVNPMDYYVDRYLDSVFAPESFEAESSSGKSTTNSFNNCSSISNSENEFISNNPFLYNDPSLIRPMGLDALYSYQLAQIEKNGLYSGVDYSPHVVLNLLRKVLETGDSVLIDRFLSTLQKDIFILMIDESMHYVFQKCVDACQGERLYSLVQEISWGRESFLNVAFYEQGIISIIKLIRKLKNTDYTFTLTEILSTRFFEIMTHHLTQTIILECLKIFGTEPNHILYEMAIVHFQDLAVHKSGCIALNKCIKTIGGVQRSMLLNLIAYFSDYLSNDRYGNYVVQFILDLKDEGITREILSRLKGLFVPLALEKMGSHVVEKCLETSGLGIIAVVQEIVETPKAALLLARDEFGNYVIQRALQITMEKGFTGLHKDLIESLKPYGKELAQTKGGKNVKNLLKGVQKKYCV